MCVTMEQYNNGTKMCCIVGNHVTHVHEEEDEVNNYAYRKKDNKVMCYRK